MRSGRPHLSMCAATLFVPSRCVSSIFINPSPYRESRPRRPTLRNKCIAVVHFTFLRYEMRAASLILCLGILLATIQDGTAERRIVCYYTNWSVYRPGTAKFSPQNINPYLCTHLIYAFGGFTKENALKPFDKYQDIEKGGYAKFTGLKTYNKNLKTMLAIGGWNEGSSRFSPMVADSARRREFVKNAVKFLRQNHFDGLDLDWEYPAFRDGGKPRDKDNYANLVQELRDEFERESSKTGRPRLLLSMAMPAGVEYIDKGYDVPRLNEYLDFVNLLTYDYHSAYEPAVNHHSPLYPLEEDNEYNYDAELTIDYTISHLLEKGMSADKIVLGIPTYGRSYTLFNQEATDLGSPADGPGTEGEATREKGYLAYYEICESIAESDDWEVVQPNPKAMGPYAFKGNQWVGYDDENVVKLKAHYVNEKKLGGIMFWSIDNDDFRGKCHGRAYPLIEAAKEALLADNSRGTTDKTKSVDSRKKIRTQSSQSNTRKSSTSNRRSSTTSPPITSKRVSSSRPKYRTISQASKEEQEDREVLRRSYDPSSNDDSEGRNTVTVTEKIERPKNRNRVKTQSSTTNSGTRRKQSRRKGQNKTNESQESLSNKLTTPEPPTTPDPGTDFKCEDEGFFPHPRDCKKYFWCLDSGPGGLGVVAHQFTCPSGLVFNKGADSCDYPRNVICPKTLKSIISTGSTTKAPITAATSRTTYLHSTTTAKAESEEYDSEEDYDEIEESEEKEEEEEEEEDDEEEKNVKEEPMIITTAKSLIYKTLTRNRPSTTTTTTTTLKPSESEKIIADEDEEDPKVIKELIDLIKKAGGIEELEKQLLLQEKNLDRSGSENVTPATISRSLYERVLNRQASKVGSQRPILSSSETSYVNGPGRAQFEGLDDIPEVKSLRRSQKPQYVTIERSKSNVKEFSSENEDENEESDNADVASSEEKTISNPLGDISSSTERVTPNYINIRRTRLSTTTSRTENDVEEKEIEIEEEKPTRRRRPFVSSKQNNEASSETSKSFRRRGPSVRKSEKKDDSKSTDRLAEKNDDSSTTKSRYSNVQRFRTTTSKSSEDLSGSSEVISETISPIKVEEYPEVPKTTASTAASLPITSTTTTSTSTEIITLISVEPSENSSSVNSKVDVSSTIDPVKLVEDSATEILFTTLPAGTSSPLATSTTLPSRSTIAVVSQPRPFGFARRRSGSSEATTTATTPLSRSKVSSTLRNSTRPSSLVGRTRLRTKPTNRVTEEELVDQVNTPHTETSTSRIKELSRLRSRGSNRYTPPTSRLKSQDVSANSVPNSRYREKNRVTSTSAETIASDSLRKRYRRPSRVSSGTESTTANELDDSSIVRITQGSSRRNPSVRSRSDISDDENDKITNIRVLRKPTVNRELYDRAKFTKKRNNVDEQRINDESNQKTSFSAETDKIEENYLLDNVDQSTAAVNFIVESNTNQPITQIDVTTLSSSIADYTSDRPEDAIATTTAHIEAHEFNPDLITIVSTERIIVVDDAEKTSTAPKKRKIFLRRRPMSSSTVASTIEKEEEKHQMPHRRKVIKRIRPLQDTLSTSDEVSLEKKEGLSLFIKTTTPMSNDKIVERSTAADNQTGVTLLNKTTDKSTIATTAAKFTKKDLISTITETTLPVNYNADSFTKVTLETPATEVTTVSSEEVTDIFNTAIISTINADANKNRQSKIEIGTEPTVMESTPVTAVTSNTESNTFSENTLIPSTDDFSTTRVQIITTLPTLNSTATFATELDSLSTVKSSFESRYARKHFTHKNPASSSRNTINRYSASTENSSLEVLSRRNNLFTRRHYPVFSSTVNTFHDNLKEQEKKEEDIESGLHNIAKQDNAEDIILGSKSDSRKSFPDDSTEFWKYYTTTSLKDETNYPSVLIDDIENRKTVRTENAEDNTYQLTSITTRGPEIRPRYKVPIVVKRPFDPEEALSPRRYSPLDSASEESEETPDTRETRLRDTNFRQPRTRYKLRDRDNIKIDEETTSPNSESTSTWQYFKTRSYPKRLTTTTEAAVTETLIPAKKFDYVADAFLRKQQSLRTTTPRSNNYFDSQNLIDPYYMRSTTVKPSVTRLVTSVTESGTTERQKILIKTKYSSLTSTTRIPADKFSPTTPLSVSVIGVYDDESVNEIRQGVERSTLPIEGEFNYHYDGRFTTESHESSTIEIESVADSEVIKLPTLKELIGYPTTYDDRTTTMSSSILLHLLRNEVDNDINRQNVEESLRRIIESQDGEKEIVQSSRDITQETADSWLEQASENKARSRAPRMEDIATFDEEVSVTNAIQSGENKQKALTTSTYFKPTTMRGIPLASLTTSSVIRGFYITRSKDDPASSTSTFSSTPAYAQANTFGKQQTETTLISDISTTEPATVTHRDRIESKSDIFNNINNIAHNKSINNEESYFAPSSSTTFSKDSDSDRPMSKKTNLLHNFDRTTPLSNSYITSPATPMRRRTALTANRYSEVTTPLWSGKRIAARKRNRTTIPPARDTIRQTETDNSIRAATSALRNASVSTDYSASTLSSRRRKLISTIPTASSIVLNYTSLEILDVHDTSANLNGTVTGDLKTHSPTEIIPTTNERIAIAKAPAVATDATITTTPSIESIESEITSLNNFLTDNSTVGDSVATSTLASTGIEIISVTTNSSTTPILDTATNVQQIAIDSENTTAAKTTNADIDGISTIVNYSTIVIPTAINMHDGITDAISVTDANEVDETISTIENYSTFTTEAIENTTIPITATISISTTLSPLTTVISSTENTQSINATVSMTINNLADINTAAANMTTTPLNLIVPTITDFNAITMSAYANVPSAINTPSIISQSKIMSTNSAAFLTSTAESSATYPVNLNNDLTTIDMNESFEALAEATTESAQTAEIRTTFTTPSTRTANTPSTPFFTLITNRPTVSLERFTTSTTPFATFGDSITTNLMYQTTTNVPDTYSVRAVNRKSEIPEWKTNINEVTSTEAQSRPEEQIIMTANKSNSVQTMSENSTISEIKTVFETAILKNTESRKQDQTTSKVETTNHQFNQKTARRRILNRTNNWLGSPLTLQRTNQYSRHRVTHRGKSRRPSPYISSSKIIEKNVGSQLEEKNLIKVVNISSDSNNTNFEKSFSKSPDIDEKLSDKRTTKRRMRVVLKSIRSKSEEKNSTVKETNVKTDSINLQNNLSNNVSINQNSSNEEVVKRRMRVILKRVKLKSEVRAEDDSTNESLQGTFSNNFYSAKNHPDEYKARRRMRVVLKSVKPKSDEKNSTAERTNVDSDSTDKNFQSAILNNSRTDKNPVEHGTKRRTRVVLKSIKPKFDEQNSRTEETNINSDSVEKDFQGSSASSFYINENLSGEKKIRVEMDAELESVKSKSKEEDSIPEETNINSDFAKKHSQVLYTVHFSSSPSVDDDLLNKNKKHKFEEKEAMTERPEDTEAQTTRMSVPVEQDTDSLEVTSNRLISRNPGNGYFNRQRKPASFTTIAPLTNPLSNTLPVHQRRRPVETTLSSRIDYVAFEDTEPYVKSTAVLQDQNAEVSDQSIHAQEFDVMLSNPPPSSSSIGQTSLRDTDRRKISTTVAPRTDPTISRTAPRYELNFRSRQKPRAKDGPTLNATTRPRRPPVIDYDYYEDEVPIIINKSALGSKLFLTNKGTIRCLDQGNFPHPYSCKKFITCARMVNGQVIGTEYTCPDRLSFDPIGGICNWSAGLGCKD
ncbi:hypothetical protein PUN28_013813 [Cardiocondyla obscurior]|uniref:chitinase n=1 Tax=Cardiocondyla obscurior TaxID=286306 RepID=A0AAW2F5U2_9HYME